MNCEGNLIDKRCANSMKGSQGGEIITMGIGLKPGEKIVGVII